MSSVVVVAQNDVVTGHALAMLIGCFLVAVIVFAAVCAAPLSSTITAPIRTINQVVLNLIARSIVDKHGGRPTFDTAIGAGATFSIRLPIAGCPAGADTTLAPDDSAPPAALPRMAPAA